MGTMLLEMLIPWKAQTGHLSCLLTFPHEGHVLNSKNG